MDGISLNQTDFGSPHRGQEPAERPRGEPVVVRTEPRRLAVLTFAADKDYLALARMTAMHVAGLLGLPIGRVTDLRLAVDEACTSFLVAARGREMEPVEESGATLQVCYDRYPDRLEVTVLGLAPPMWPGQDELGWAVLRAIIGDVNAEVIDGVGILTLVEPLPAID